MKRVIAAFLATTVVGCGSGSTDGTPPSSRENTSTTASHDTESIAAAAAFLETLDLPDEGMPPGWLEVERILGLCIASFGFEVLEPELALESGVFYFYAGEQIEAVNQAQRSCQEALLRSGHLLPINEETHRIRYRALIEVHDCLEDKGFPTTQPPSIDAFVESPDGWNPWEAMLGDADPPLPTPEFRASATFGEYFDSLEDCPRP